MGKDKIREGWGKDTSQIPTESLHVNFFTFIVYGAKISISTVSKKEYRTDIPPSNELHLRHLTIDEALPRLDQYLHDAFRAGLIQVRVIHGKGTGTLRQMVRRELGRHPLVKSFRPGDYGEGGEGVTIAELDER